MAVNRTAKALKTMAFSVMLTACDILTDDGWSTAKTESAIDGISISATKEFSSETNPTIVRAVLTCVEERQDVTLTIESYAPQSNDDQLQASPIIFSDGNPKGRAVRQTSSRERQVYNLADLFTDENYNNVIKLDAARLSAFEWIQKDEKSFWQWAATTSPDREIAAKEQYLAALKLPFQAIAIQNFPLAMVGIDVGITAQMKEQMLRTTRDVVSNARSVNSVAKLGTGAYLQEKLPLAIELYNGGGIVEILIPDNNKTVNGILAKCNGSPWFGSRITDVPSKREEQIAESSAVPSSPPPPIVDIDNKKIPSAEIDFDFSYEARQNGQINDRRTSDEGNTLYVQGDWELNLCSSPASRHGGRMNINSETALFVTAYNDSTVLRIEGRQSRASTVQLIGKMQVPNSQTFVQDTVEIKYINERQIFLNASTLPSGMQIGPYRKCSSSTQD